MEKSKELGKKKINDTDLGTVSGGCGGKKPPDPHYDDHYKSLMECENCRSREYWKGDWSCPAGRLLEKYDCSVCGKKELFCRKVNKVKW